MSANERYIKQGQLAEVRAKLEKLTDRAEGVLDSIRMATFVSPLATPFEMDASKISNYAEEFAEVYAEGAKLRAAISKLEDDLGV